MANKLFKLPLFVTKYGADNILFVEQRRPLRGLVISFTSSSDNTVWVITKLSDERYPVDGNYKVTLVSVGLNTDIDYGSEHYYVSDLEKLITQGSINMYVLQDGKLIEWKELEGVK